MGFWTIVIVSQIDLFVFNGSPKTLDKNIVPPKSLAIHADLDGMLGEQVCKSDARKLVTPPEISGVQK